MKTINRKSRWGVFVSTIVLLWSQFLCAQNDTIKYFIHLKDQQTNAYLNGVKIKVVDDKNNSHEYTSDSILRIDLLKETKYFFKFSKNGYNVKSEYITPNVAVQNKTENTSVYMQSTQPFVEKIPVLFFKKNSAELVDSSSFYSLQWFSEYIKDNLTNSSFEIMSFSDCTEKGQRIAKKRAKYVYGFFIKNGVAKEKIKIIQVDNNTPFKIISNEGLQSFFPIGMVLSEAEIQKMPKDRQELARRLNRRVEFRINR